ncbi:uncharacterized protein LOC100167868 isoform X2 [Acyrthosiphon pisum]|uniref:Uncharacterized protein n=1 Tax=Acyrthosiphon pisum TaxID=7029 RepID=A0A8R2B829_ACYPI|nr:uncharacterized protein LOC100167868 isoform X2 [Acyrthosiphon pisum]|eukprot:XP_008185792.1 PREDICTED: uncharacterized protein LOC100167868 isoform X2 [Acyrthosiphon pisum]
MASVISVPANEGISVKNEHDDPEINAMALKMKENYQKNATAAAKQQAASPANVYINRAGRAVTLTNAPIITNNTQKNQDKLPKDCEDVESIKGRFSWKLIAGYNVPYIIRVINGEHLKFVSVRMAETQLLSNYLHYLHADIYTCTSVRSHFITEAEAKLLNDINQKHTECIYGKEMFFQGKDYIVRLEDVHEFYTFIEVCYKKLLCNITPGRREKCGFIRINSESVVPYCIKDNQKYVPLFYFEGETENLKHRAVKLENWNLAYLKFCCKVQGIRNELFASDSCTVTSLDDIKNYFPPETNFEEYWPAKVVDTQLLTNQKSTHVNPPGAWIRAPPEVVPAENSIPLTLTAPASLPQSMPVLMNTYQNGWPANQMGSTVSQSSSLVNSASHVVPPPPLVRAGNSTPVIGNTVSYSNVVPISQCITTMYNPMTNSNVMSHSSQMRQFYNQRSNNNQAQQQQLQQQQIQQQQQIITTPQTQQPYSGQSVHGRLTNTQQRNALRNAGSVVVAPPLEIIDLSSPPSSPVPPTVQENPRSNIAWELTRIPERMWAHDTTNNAAYKIQKATLQGRMIHCINAKAYIYSDLMVTLDDLVQMVLPLCTVPRCAYVLNKYLKTTLFTGNSEQLAVLRENGRLRSMYPDDTPMAMLQDITHVLPQLKTLILKHDEQIQQYQAAAAAAAAAGGPAKRQRTS